METQRVNRIDWQSDFRRQSLENLERKTRKKRRLAMWSFTVDIRYEFRTCSSLIETLQATTIPDLLREELDEYPDWHPAPYDFEPMVQALLYKELTNRNYKELARALRRCPEVPAGLGLSSVPDASTFSQTWRNRFPEELREMVRFWVSQIREYAQQYGVPIETVRTKPEEKEDDT